MFSNKKKDLFNFTERKQHRLFFMFYSTTGTRDESLVNENLSIFLYYYSSSENIEMDFY